MMHTCTSAGVQKPSSTGDIQGQCMETKGEETCTLVEGVDNIDSGSGQKR
jgi:hypothetical protein